MGPVMRTLASSGLSQLKALEKIPELWVELAASSSNEFVNGFEAPRDSAASFLAEESSEMNPSCSVSAASWAAARLRVRDGFTVNAEDGLREGDGGEADSIFFLFEGFDPLTCCFGFALKGFFVGFGLDNFNHSSSI